MIRLAKPFLGEEEEAAASEVLRSGQLVQAHKVRDFENAVAAYLKMPHAVACSSGTAALYLALKALRVRPGDEVLVPDFTFPATANAVEIAGATPVFGDVRADTWNLDLARAPRAEHAIPVDCFGLPCDLPPEGGVVEDAACALGASRPRAWAPLVCLSFHPRKIITTGEGGMVVCRDADMAARIRRLRDHGKEGTEFVEAALNLRMTEVAAAIGLVQMARLPAFIEWRATLVETYRERLGRDERIALQAVPPGMRHAWQTFAVRLRRGTDRDAVIRKLRDSGIEAGVATYALHRLEHHSARYGLRRESFPESDALHDRGLALPLHNGLDVAEVHQVCDRLLAILDDR